MVSVPVPGSMSNYCIDATEVTNAAYSAFLATNPSTTMLPAPCAQKTSFVPGLPIDPARPNYPVTQVDWCDAWSFCAAAGKHLCGRIGGGNTLGGVETGDAHKSEWYNACSRGGSQLYPYPGMYSPGLCVDRQYQTPRPVGTSTRCVGGYSGIFDMSGNLGEWENECTTGAGGDQCGTRGGNYNDQTTLLTCTSVIARNRTQRFNAVGFRCCF